MERTLQQTNSNCIKVVLFGPESTGKSTLAKELADHYNSIYIEEYASCLLYTSPSPRDAHESRMPSSA